jgi:5,10-methylenetetrahydromethanopterin reductase
MRTGVVLQAVDAPPAFIDLVSRIDELDYHDLWLTDSSLHARNCWSYLALAATASSRLMLGTAVTNPVTRHPGITVAAAATIDEISGGRFVLGIGAGDRPLKALAVEPARLATLRASLRATRALLAGERVSVHDSRFDLVDAHLRFEARADLPIYVSASGPQTLRLAGAEADGVILLCGLFAEGVSWALERVDDGARAAGRPRPHVAVFAYGAIDDDQPDAALAAARSIAAWFPQSAPRYCELAGLDPAIALAVRARYDGGEFQEAGAAAALLPAEFVRRMALAGDRASARDQLTTLRDLGVDSVHVFPLGPGRAATIEAFAEVSRSLTEPTPPDSEVVR